MLKSKPDGIALCLAHWSCSHQVIRVARCCLHLSLRIACLCFTADIRRVYCNVCTFKIAVLKQLFAAGLRDMGSFTRYCNYVGSASEPSSGIARLMRAGEEPADHGPLIRQGPPLAERILLIDNVKLESIR